jgi:membrane protein
MVIALGLLIILGTVFSLALAWFGSIVTQFINSGSLLLTLEILALLAVIVLANAFIYKVLPDVKLTWRDVLPGSVAAACLLGIGGILIGLYFRYAESALPLRLLALLPY